MSSYMQIIKKVYKGKEQLIPDVLLCLDPGETTGYAVFKDGFLTAWGQCATVVSDGKKKQIDWNAVVKLFNYTKPTQVVCEDYKIYAHKLERHTFSSVETLRLIGGIDMLCKLNFPQCLSGILIDTIPIAYQMAFQGKGFATDARLKEWGFWKEGMKHSRDAIRHGIYYLLVTNLKKVK